MEIYEEIMNQAKHGDVIFSANTPVTQPSLFHLSSFEFKSLKSTDKIDRNLLRSTAKVNRCLLLLSGNITLKDAYGKRVLEPGNVLLSSGSDALDFPIPSIQEDIIYIRLSVSGEIALNAFHYISRSFGPAQKLPLNCQTFKAALRLTQFLKSDDAKNPYRTSAEAYHWFQNWWSDLDRLANARIRKIRHHATPENLVKTGLVTVKAYAQFLGNTNSHLSEKLSKSWNVAPGKALRMARLSEAARLLEKTELSINEIAEKMGYSSASSFIRAFKVTYSVTPSAYRIQHTAQNASA
ncbi:helix-turn-helix transcriptional regulator [Rubellicoccus peritrichatus]|uniref:Helix-turn-helix transcriptional regulator n=1 Tax=Rubellicoccus peritrichatus TaxID=3080537 RepID=A0AAQ3QVF6_9BACT|nr:helix-turn-helix transcriptional regulator [Puniceicoccus sp. CR14]WOO41553.1 helix-turn-helix transcriptional regulator [Puniceicoccus sp. CR14]